MAVPLAAVFTEKSSETGVYERFVYVVQEETEAVEKRNVKVGVSDFFFAEIQEGLTAGEVVSLELPKEEREKKAKELTRKRPGGGEGEAASMKAAGAPVSGSLSNSPGRGKSGEGRRRNRGGDGGSSR
jgi:hypothetical protein